MSEYHYGKALCSQPGVRGSAIALVVLWCLGYGPRASLAQSFTAEVSEHSLVVRHQQQEVAQYVFRDPVTTRPYLTHIKTLGGIQVSRNHPPQKGVDADDHATMHPGMWLAFGDLNGADSWRLKTPVEHVEFLQKPTIFDGQLQWRVRNRYLATDRKTPIAEEQQTLGLKLIEGGYLICLHSQIQPVSQTLVFGDQEEMGLGMRLATPLAVDRSKGGRMVDDQHRHNGKEIWGKTVQWCDYAGPLEGKWVGMTIMAHPKNFRASWAHARDYGFIALNPFARQAFTKQSPELKSIPVGEVLELKFAVAVHESSTEEAFLPSKAYQQYCEISP